MGRLATGKQSGDTPTPNPSPQGGGEQVTAAARLNVRSVIAFAAGVVLGFGALATVALQDGLEGAQAQQSSDGLTSLKARFARPTYVPHPADNAPSAPR